MVKKKPLVPWYTGLAPAFIAVGILFGVSFLVAVVMVLAS